MSSNPIFVDIVAKIKGQQKNNSEDIEIAKCKLIAGFLEVLTTLLFLSQIWNKLSKSKRRPIWRIRK
jgi:ribosomal protein S8